MPLALALFQPDIPQNAGTLMRLSACMGIPLHFIHPAGFVFSDTKFRRAGMDYLDRVRLIEHVSFAAFDTARRAEGRRLVLLTTKATTSAYAAAYTPNDILMVGRESAGVPDTVAARADLKVRIPMAEGLRSLNVALAAATVLGEALRQVGELPGA
ncbi:MAG: tRNA methyltransferase [Alphaproteobacteria bacterium]|nr:tRNA methyltransferase [Alphaproteobacteria bacterium]